MNSSPGKRLYPLVAFMLVVAALCATGAWAAGEVQSSAEADARCVVDGQHASSPATPERLPDSWQPQLRTLSGVVLDETTATYTGDWTTSGRQAPLVGESYRHDNNQRQQRKTAVFEHSVSAAGDYEVRLLYSPHENRSSRTSVVVEAGKITKSVRVDQRSTPLLHGIARACGSVTLGKGETLRVTISNEGSDGYVVVDGLQIVPLETALRERAAAKEETAKAIAEQKARYAKIQLATPARPEDIHNRAYDIVVIGATPGGIACAVRAARQGASVLLVQHNDHIGGMMTNGLTQWDALYGGHRSPLFSELLANIERYYADVYGPQSAELKAARYSQKKYPLGMVEPHVAEREFNRLVANEKNITLLLEWYPEELAREGKTLKAVTLRQRQGAARVKAKGKVFIDATYEADLAALAEVPYRVGREARDEFNEPHAGKLFTNIAGGAAPQAAVDGKLNIRPYSAQQGKVDPESPFTADGAIQAYNMRFSVTRDPQNRILPEKPANYDRTEYLHFKRRYIGSRTGPRQKAHMNSPILPGENHDYPEADWEQRDAITQRHLEFGLGLMYFLQNDPSLSEKQRAAYRQWGLPRDEYTDNNHVPYEMYVREARRIVGRHVYTEHDNSLAAEYGRTPIHADSIAITDWYMDSHACTLDSRPNYKYDGKLILTQESRPGQIPYRSLLPQGVDNMLVPVCLSATHVAWGAVRLEPVWLQTGEAAGFAAAMAVATGAVPADIDAEVLIRQLAKNRMMVSFFNDVDVAGEDDWIPGVQWAGTKGFFATYDAHPEQPLTTAEAQLWAASFAELVSAKLAPQRQAARLTKSKAMDSPSISAGDFAKLIQSHLDATHPKAAKLISQMQIPAELPISRGNACQLMFLLREQ